MPRDLAAVSGKVQWSGSAKISSIQNLIGSTPLEFQTFHWWTKKFLAAYFHDKTNLTSTSTQLPAIEPLRLVTKQLPSVIPDHWTEFPSRLLSCDLCHNIASPPSRGNTPRQDALASDKD